MSIYSTTEVYPSSFDEIDAPANCYNCTNDCMGVFLDTIVRNNEERDFDNLTFEERCDYNYKLNSIFNGKNYTSVNCLPGNYFCRVSHLSMYKSEVPDFKTDLKEKGYNLEIIDDPNNRYKCMVVILKDGIINPFSIINLFKDLPVRGDD